MKTTLFEKVIYGKWIFINNPAKRFFFHFLALPFAMYYLMIPVSYISKTVVFILYFIFSIFWTIWSFVAFFGWCKKWSAETTKEEKEFSWKISTGTCPRCYQKIPRLATKCPHCTADI